MPGWLVALFLISAAYFPALLWPSSLRVSVWLLQAGFALADWLSLALLPRFKRSFGPVNPPLLALTAVRVVITGGIGFLSPGSGLALTSAGMVQLAILVLTLHGLWVAPFQLRVNFEQLSSPKLDPARPPVRLLHLGDLHIERETIRERRLQEIIDELAPDVILFSGDFISLSYGDDPETHQAIRRVIGQWQAPYGVFAVSGTPKVESGEMVASFVAGTGVHWLHDEVAEVDIRGQKLSLVGVGCQHKIPQDVARTEALVEQTPSDLFRVLLFHSPEIAPQAAQMGIGLYLCGHTHGGQWRLPLVGAVLTSSALGKRYVAGRYTVGEMALYVTRGIGLEGASAPRARLLCSPEVTLWTLSG